MRVQHRGGLWTNAEDEVLKAALQKYGSNQWSRIASLLPRKSAKQCKARWNEWLSPSIRKTEWTREEEERLLHLAKIMPTQWRTIAPMVGRTAAQCLEHYERLLEDAQRGAAEGDGAGASSTDPLIAAGDARRARHEHEMAAESKPARPDPVDMNEEEKEMLSEARARLANTRGKKAKRKAREKQLEAAKRLAQLQKRRELKAAGVEVKPKKRRRDVMDLATEVPFARAPVPGFYDTRAEDEAAARDKRDARGLGRLITKYDTQRATEGMDFEARKNAYKRKVVFGDPGDAPPAAKEEQPLKRSRLSLPAPQVSDMDLETIAKAGVSAASTADPGSGGAAGTSGLGGGASFMSGVRHPLLATPMGSISTSVAGTPRTGGRGGQVWADVRDQQLRDIVKLQSASTPLVGGDNSVLPKSLDVNGSVTPMATVQQTPNLLATPSIASFGSMSSRDMNDAELARAEKARLQVMKRDLKKGFDALPDPENEYEINVTGAALPDVGNSDDEAASTADILEDAEDEVKRLAAEGKALLAITKQRTRSMASRRGLPVPKLPLRADVATEEIRDLVERDSIVQSILAECERSGANLSDAAVAQRLLNVALPDSDDDYLKQARALVDAEAKQQVPDGGSQEDILSAIRAQHEKGVTRLWTVSASGDVVEAKTSDDLKEMFRQRSSHASMLKKLLKTQQRNLELRFGGFQTKRSQLQKELYETMSLVKKAREELACFTMLAEGEEAALPRRVAELEAAADGQQRLHAELQKEYARRTQGTIGAPAEMA
jgi:pre-mRNA-splicing factor CDC5/CEF1